MEIQNKDQAGTKLIIGGEPKIGDAEGVFDLPEKHAKMLLNTKGWHLPIKEPKPVAEAEPEAAPQEAAEAPEPEAEAPEAAEPEDSPTAAATEPEEPEDTQPTPAVKKKRKPRR